MVKVERADLLPFIQYVAVFRYLEEISACGKKYEAKKAKEQFVILATRFLPPVIWLLSQKNMSSIRCCYLAFKKMTAICTKNWQNNW